MESFEYENRTKIVFGRGELENTGRIARGYGTRFLLVTGRKSARATGTYDRVRNLLEAEEINVFDLDNVQSNPVLSRVRDGIEAVKKHRIEAVLALGGGSVMDTAKAVAAGSVLEKGDVWDFFTGKSEIENALPVLTVPTIAASGSEMNGFMVITDEKNHHKLAASSPSVYPRVSILDPVLTCTVGPDYTAYGGVDAVCHLLEPYFNGSAPSTPVQDRIAEGLIINIMDATGACIRNPHDYESRATMLWSAALALCGLTKAGVGDHFFPVHMIEHSISALFPVAHGAGLAALLPGWMTWWAEGNNDKVAQLGERIWQIRENDTSDAARKTVQAFRTWLAETGCPQRLSDIGITPGEHRNIAENAMKQAGIWNVADLYSVETIETILAYCV